LSTEVFRAFMVVAAIGTVLAAAYLLWMLQRVGMGTVPDEWQDHNIPDVQPSEWLAWVPLLVMIVVLGVVPAILMGTTDDAVQGIVKIIAAAGK
jgi:NADH-quinone oxidoreductase subunit M